MKSAPNVTHSTQDSRRLRQLADVLINSIVNMALKPLNKFRAKKRLRLSGNTLAQPFLKSTDKSLKPAYSDFQKSGSAGKTVFSAEME